MAKTVEDVDWLACNFLEQPHWHLPTLCTISRKCLITCIVFWVWRRLLDLLLTLLLLFQYLRLDNRYSVHLTNIIHAPSSKTMDTWLFHQIVFIKIQGNISIDFCNMLKICLIRQCWKLHGLENILYLFNFSFRIRLKSLSGLPLSAGLHYLLVFG